MSHVRVAAIDFDDTLVRYDETGLSYPMPGAREALEKLRAAGVWIVIYTCRIPIARRRGHLNVELEFIANTLDAFGIPFDEIFTGDNKVIADVYVDDRAVAFEGDWAATIAQTLQRLNRP